MPLRISIDEFELEDLPDHFLYFRHVDYSISPVLDACPSPFLLLMLAGSSSWTPKDFWHVPRHIAASQTTQMMPPRVLVCKAAQLANLVL